MKQWFVLFQKEMIESLRNYRWIWLPLVFVMLGVMQPIVAYFLPQIIESAGGLPEGAVIELPTPTGGQVMMEALSNLNTLGLLVLVLAFMGTIASERTSGVAGMILVKRVSFTSYVTAKWAAAILITFVAVVLGMLSAWYYTEELIGPVSVSAMTAGGLLFFVWLMLIVTITVFLSAAMRSNGVIAFLTLLITMIFSLVSSLYDSRLKWSPWLLSDYAGASFVQDGAPGGAWIAVIIAVICMILLLASAISILRRKELVG